MGAADLDGDGLLNLVEWLGATIFLPEEQVEGLVAEAFAFMDADHDGFLTRAELVRGRREGRGGGREGRGGEGGREAESSRDPNGYQV